MKNLWLRFSALAFGGSLLSQPVLAQAAVDHLVKVDQLRVLSDHVQIIPDGNVPLVPNVGFVVGDRAVLVVDTGLGLQNGRAIAAVAERLAGPKAIYLATTHFHPEHDLGAQGFPAWTILIRIEDQEADIREFGPQIVSAFSARSAVVANLLKDATYRSSDITLDQALDLDLGSVKVRLMALGPNHTRGDLAVWVETDKVLFSGDTAMKAQPAFASSYSRIAHWLDTLNKLEALKPALIVPSHGPVGDVGLITGYRTYLLDIRERASAAKKAGRDIDQAANDIASGLADRYPDRNRLTGAARAAYGEAQ